MIIPIGAALLAAALYAVGKWGRDNAAELVPQVYSREGRRHKEKVLRRGAVSCQVFAAMLLAFAVLTLFDGS